jgi:hypothetical protein
MGRRMKKNKKNKQNKAATISTTTTTAKTNVLGYSKVTTLPKTKRTEVTTEYKPKIVLSDEFLQKVAYLHKNVKANTEWSAILLYSNKEGSVDDANKWVILVEDCILMDIGTSAYTEYDMEAGDDHATERWMDHLEKGGKIGHLHTHHNMNCYFSLTDMGELHENAPHHNYYLSLIVNYRDINAWCAKVAICGEEETEGTMTVTKSWVGAKGPMTKAETDSIKDTKSMLYMMDCELIPESETHVPNGLQERIDSIVKKKAAPIANTYSKNKWWSHDLNTEAKIDSGNKTTSKKNTQYSAGIMSMGNGNTRPISSSPAKVHQPYSASGTSIDDLDDDDFWGGVFDTNGKLITPHTTDVANSKKEKRKTIVEKFSPEVCAPILAQILTHNLDTQCTLDEIVYPLEEFNFKALDKHMDECAALFTDYVSLHFVETLTPLHLHAIAVSMYNLLIPYEMLVTYDVIDTMLAEYLMGEGDFVPTVIKQMTGVEIENQVCL